MGSSHTINFTLWLGKQKPRVKFKKVFPQWKFCFPIFRLRRGMGQQRTSRKNSGQHGFHWLQRIKLNFYLKFWIALKSCPGICLRLPVRLVGHLVVTDNTDRVFYLRPAIFRVVPTPTPKWTDNNATQIAKTNQTAKEPTNNQQDPKSTNKIMKNLHLLQERNVLFAPHRSPRMKWSVTRPSTSMSIMASRGTAYCLISTC